MDFSADYSEARALALSEAVKLASLLPQRSIAADLARDVTTIADALTLTLLRGVTVNLVIIPGRPVSQHGGVRAPLIMKDGIMQLTDTQQVTLTVQPEDSKGNPTSDTLTWTASLNGGDASGAVTLTVAADTLSATVVAGNPATGVLITVSDANGISGSLAIDVVPGTAASLVISAGTPEEQPPAA